MDLQATGGQRPACRFARHYFFPGSWIMGRIFDSLRYISSILSHKEMGSREFRRRARFLENRLKERRDHDGNQMA